MLKKCSKHNI